MCGCDWGQTSPQDGQLFSRDEDYRKRNDQWHALAQENLKVLRELNSIHRAIEEEIDSELGSNEGMSETDLENYRLEREKLRKAKESKHPAYPELQKKNLELGRKIESMERADPFIGFDPLTSAP